MWLTLTAKAYSTNVLLLLFTDDRPEALDFHFSCKEIVLFGMIKRIIVSLSIKFKMHEDLLLR